MDLTEIVLSIVFSGLLIIIMITVYHVCKSKLRQKKFIKRAAVDIKLGQSELNGPFPEYIEYRDISIEEKTSGRYKPVKLRDDKRINKDHPHIERPIPQNNQNKLSAMQVKTISKRFSRLEKII